jgi:hypothetical protein
MPWTPFLQMEIVVLAKIQNCAHIEDKTTNRWAQPMDIFCLLSSFHAISAKNEFPIILNR